MNSMDRDMVIGMSGILLIIAALVVMGWSHWIEKTFALGGKDFISYNIDLSPWG